MRRLTLEEFIERARKKHGDKYDYSKVVYVDAHTNVCIICPEHGEFWQKPHNHLNGKGCRKCGGTNPSTTKEFVEKAKKNHGEKYDYSKTNYINDSTKVCIICCVNPHHGEFWQTPDNHLRRKSGCPKCYGNNKQTNEDFIKKATEKHGRCFDYSKCEYVNNYTEICIICPLHGEFWQQPRVHLLEQGCPKCYRDRQRLTNEEFVERAKKVHIDKYNYSKTEYTNSHTKVCIICKKHGEFWQRPNTHLQGVGCPDCISSKLEESVAEFLKKHNFYYERQQKFNWLRNKNLLKLDFYLPTINMAIECQGIQHFKPMVYFGDQEGFEYLQQNDKLKKELCEKHNVPLYYINYNDNVEEKLNEILGKLI